MDDHPPRTDPSDSVFWLPPLEHYHGITTAANEAQDDGLDAAMAGEDGVKVVVGGLEADAVGFLVEAFEGGVVVIDQGDDQGAVVGGAGAAAQDEVAGADAFVDHAAADDLQGEQFVAVAEQGPQGQGFGVFDGLDGRSGGDAAQERNAFDGFGRRRCVVEIAKQPLCPRGRK